MIRCILDLTRALRAHRRTTAGTLVLVSACLTAGYAPVTCDPSVAGTSADDASNNASDCDLLSCEKDADCAADHPYCVKGACRTNPVMNPGDA